MMTGPMTNLSVLKIQVDNLYYKRGGGVYHQLEDQLRSTEKKFVDFGFDHEATVYFTDADYDWYHPIIHKFFRENKLSGRLTVIKDGKLIKKKFKFNKDDRKANPIGD